MDLTEVEQDLLVKKPSYIYPKVQYFLTGAGFSFWGRYAGLWFDEHGLSKSQIGILTSIIPFVSSLASPFWGMVVDKIGHRQYIMGFCLVSSSIVLEILNFTEGFETFGVILGFMTLYAALNSFWSILDTAVLDILGPDKHLYGNQRLWCAVSWGIFGAAAGFILDQWGWTGLFITYGILQACGFINLVMFYPRERSERNLKKAATSFHMVSIVVREVLGKLKNVIFFGVMIVFGIAYENVEDFLFIYLVESLKASDFLCGITISVTVIFELPVFGYSSYLSSTIGIMGMIVLAQICHIVRVIVYTFLTPDTVWWVMAVEPLHGITFACMWAAAIEYACMISPKGLETTTQGLLTGFFAGIGFGCGGIIGGFLYQSYGPIVMYRTGAIIVFVAMIAFIIGFSCLETPQKVDQEDAEDGLLDLDTFK